MHTHTHNVYVCIMSIYTFVTVINFIFEAFLHPQHIHTPALSKIVPYERTPRVQL